MADLHKLSDESLLRHYVDVLLNLGDARTSETSSEAIAYAVGALSGAKRELLRRMSADVSQLFAPAVRGSIGDVCDETDKRLVGRLVGSILRIEHYRPEDDVDSSMARAINSEDDAVHKELFRRMSAARGNGNG